MADGTLDMPAQYLTLRQVAWALLDAGEGYIVLPNGTVTTAGLTRPVESFIPRYPTVFRAGHLLRWLARPARAAA